jgi:hypothetical protein
MESLPAALFQFKTNHEADENNSVKTNSRRRRSRSQNFLSMSIELWNSRPRVSPADQLRALADECTKLDIQACDVYGDFDSSPEQSYLRRFESEIAATFGKEDVSRIRYASL